MQIQAARSQDRSRSSEMCAARRETLNDPNLRSFYPLADATRDPSPDADADADADSDSDSDDDADADADADDAGALWREFLLWCRVPVHLPQDGRCRMYSICPAVDSSSLSFLLMCFNCP